MAGDSWNFQKNSWPATIAPMQLPTGSSLQARPWTWLLKAILAGSVPTGLVALYFGAHDPKPLLLSSLIGAVFSVIIWGGYELTSGWLERHPASLSPYRAALLIFGKWILVYLLLVTVSIGLVRVLFGINCVENRQNAFFTVFIGLVISGPIVNLRAISRMVAAARELEQARAQAGFLSLKAQLSPHTLFNALNTIAALIPEDPRAAEQAVERLSALLRRILSALEKERWSLGEEFQLLRDLLDIQEARFGERLTFELELPESEQERDVPPLLLLPLVENSLKHGFAAKVGSCHLTVRAKQNVIQIQDDGLGRDEHAPEGVGIRTVRQRVEALGGSLSWPQVQSGCLVEVHLCR
jgi:two-component sensor histidine kinase